MVRARERRVAALRKGGAGKTTRIAALVLDGKVKTERETWGEVDGGRERGGRGDKGGEKARGDGGWFVSGSAQGAKDSKGAAPFRAMQSEKLKAPQRWSERREPGYPGI